MTEIDKRLQEPRSMTYVYDMIQERASEDEGFRAHLLKDAHGAVKSAFGVDMPQNLKVQVHEMHQTVADDGSAIGHIVLPPPSKLTDEQMKGISGARWTWDNPPVLAK